MFLVLVGLVELLSSSQPFISPLSDKRVSILSVVRIKLEQKLNTYSLKNNLKKESSFFNQTYAAAPYDGASAYAMIDFEKGEVLAEKSLSQRLPIASLTKIMTAVTALDLASPDEIITIKTDPARIEPTKLVLESGEKLKLEQLLNATLLTSANDAARAIQDGIDVKYGAPVFIEAMNIKAKYIGLKNTHFTNPQGFDNRKNYSTVEDLAILSHYALTKYPLIAEIVKKDQEYIEETGYHKRYVLYNWNGLVGVYPNVFGVKIGNTDDAGTTIVAGSERGGKKLLVVLLGAPGVLERDLWTSQLFDLGFEKTLGLFPMVITEYQLREKYATWVTWN